MTITAATPSGSLPHPVILWIAQLRAWVFLILLVVFFEVWARAAEGYFVRFQHLQPPVDPGVRHRAAAAGARSDVRHHLLRHRPVARLRDGPVVGDRGARLQLLHGAHGAAAVRGDAVGDPVGDGGRRHPRPGQRPVDRASADPAVHRHARHVWRRARRGLSVRRRHDGRDRQRLVLGHRQRPRLWRAGAGDHHRRRLPDHALHAVADAFRPAHLRASARARWRRAAPASTSSA